MAVVLESDTKPLIWLKHSVLSPATLPAMSPLSRTVTAATTLSSPLLPVGLMLDVTIFLCNLTLCLVWFGQPHGLAKAEQPFIHHCSLANYFS